MTVPFKNVPAALRVPLFYAELDNSQANTSTNSQRSLIIGQVTAAAIAAGTVSGVPVMSQGLADAVAVGGAGSMLALMTAAYRGADNFGEVWYLPLADDPAALAAAGTLTITAPPAASGTLYTYIAGSRIAQPVLAGQAPNLIAAALCAAINATSGLPVTATVAGAVVTVTAVNKGPGGNDIDLRLNYLGTRGGESLPAGLRMAIVPMSGGATAPNLAASFLNLGAMEFDFIAMPYTDATSLNAIQVLLSDTAGRWSWDVQVYGGFFAASRGNVVAQTVLGAARNDAHGSITGFNDSPTPSWIWAAAITGAAAVSLRADPATPLQTIALPGVLPPPIQSRFQLTDRNALLFSGISTFSVGDDDTVYVENLITTYQKNAFGSADSSYLQVETLYTLAFVLRDLKSVITSKYARVKLAADGTRFSGGANIVTPNIIRGDLIGQYRKLEKGGYVQNGDAFKANLVVQQNAQNPNRVDVLYPPELINQLRVFAVLGQFQTGGTSFSGGAAGTPPVSHLQLPRAVGTFAIGTAAI